MLRSIPYIILAILVYTGLFYMQNYQPETMHSMLMKIDVFGITPTGEEEQARQQRIRSLTIPYEEKQVLMQRTVFMGATSGMVKLALGEPKKVVERIWENNPTRPLLIYYVYFLVNDSRPTVLIFQDDRLINAYKGSALDVGN